MVLNEWLGCPYRFLYRLLRLCHRAKRYLLATYVSLLWLLDSPFMVLFMPKREPVAVVFPQWFMDWAGPKYINRRIKKMEKEF
jgi:hypothetical protein